jgi:uncharacterized protein (TIGR02453 family)
MPKRSYFSRELFQFLVELKFNNERAWFNANKARYEAQVKQPLLRFIADLAPRLKRVNPAFEASPRSFFRIYRDTRFAKDKTPYKTHAAAQFRHRSAPADVHAPGFYLHLEPGECFIGGGLWMAEPETLKAVRVRIARQDPAWMAIKRSKMPLWDQDSLKRAPKGFDPGHPLLGDLLRRHYITWVDITDKQACADDFMDRFVASAKKINPLMRFLCTTMGLKG